SEMVNYGGYKRTADAGALVRKRLASKSPLIPSAPPSLFAPPVDKIWATGYSTVRCSKKKRGRAQFGQTGGKKATLKSPVLPEDRTFRLSQHIAAAPHRLDVGFAIRGARKLLVGTNLSIVGEHCLNSARLNAECPEAGTSGRGNTSDFHEFNLV